MKDLIDKHPYFQKWADPATGVESYILTERVAPMQKAFYFVNPSISADRQWLWLEVAFPPARPKMLAAVRLDPAAPQIVLLPHTSGFIAESPLIAAEGDAAYVAMGSEVWRASVGGKMDRICGLSHEYIAGRTVHRLCTHLTLSADGKYMLLDGEVGNVFFVGLGDLATGEVRILHEFARRYNHAQFSPHEPDLFLIAQDWWHDSVTGKRFPFEIRTWIMNTHQTVFEPAVPGLWAEGHNCNASHEWWTADGRIAWVDYAKGVFVCDLKSRQVEHLWAEPLCHAHCDPTMRYWCADESPYRWDKTPCQVRFRDIQTGLQTHIASAMPQPCYPRRWYHLDPHPHFSPRGDAVVYTTTVRGTIDAAIAPLAGILDRLNPSRQA